MTKPPTTRSVIARLKKLLLQRDIEAIHQGVELTVSVDNTAVRNTLLDGVTYDPGGEFGRLVPNKIFSTTKVGQPWHDLAVTLLLAHSSLPLKNQVTSLTVGSKNIKTPLPVFSIKGYNKFPNLERLQIQNITDLKDTDSLGQCETLKQLEISATDFQNITTPPNLQHLTLNQNEQNKPIDLAQLSTIKTLTNLNLSCNRINAEDTKNLTKLTKLTHLELNRNDIGFKGMEQLAKLSDLTHLELNLNGNDIGNEGAHALTKLTNLTHLELGWNDIGDTGAESLSKLKNLTHLQLSGNDIGDTGAQALSKLKNLTHLQLNHNNIGDTGAHALTNLSNLTHLQLSWNNISDEGIMAFLRTSATTENQLAYLNVQSNYHPDSEINEINGTTDASTVFATFRRLYLT